MSVVSTTGFHNISKMDIVPCFRDGALEYVDVRFYDANREDPDEYDELTVWATRDGKTKGRVEVELEGEPVGIIAATPFAYSGEDAFPGEEAELADHADAPWIKPSDADE